MTPELLTATFLAQSTVTAVASSVALSQLPKGAAFPAIVYQTIDLVPQRNVNHLDGTLAQARVQITGIAKSIAELKSVLAAVRTVMDYQHNVTVGGATVVSSRFASMGFVDRDNESGLWVQSADYLVLFYE